MLTKSITCSSYLQKLMIAILVVTIAYFYNINYNLKTPIIKTCSGNVQGIIGWSRDNREYYKYLGIPFAKPPIGKLRFEPPQLPKKWDDVRYVGKFGSNCVQVQFMASLFFGEEDCLYLNVYIPKDRDVDKHIPVIVWIYGGMFMEGMADMYGPDYLMDEDIVLVTFNYRVGALGFLNTNDHVVRGNMGLKDQTFVLEWVQRNIKNFGGNPGQVTIAGQSAGAASVHYHMLSPLSKGLFHKAISASGVAISPWAFNKNPYQQAVRFASRFCPIINTTQMVSCLRKIPYSLFQDVQLEAVDLLRDPLSVFVPTVEAINDSGTFLLQNPLESAKNGSVSKIPWLVGVTSHEGLMFTAMTLTNSTLQEAAVNDWINLIPKTMYIKPNINISKQIKQEYFENLTQINPTHSPQYITNFTNLFSDRHFFNGIHNAGKYHSKYSSVYLYFLNHSPKYSVANLLQANSIGIYPIINIALHIFSRYCKEKFFGIKIYNNETSHIDDLHYIFNLGIPLNIEDENENKMSRRMIKMYTSFASNFDQMDFGGIPWPPIDFNMNDTTTKLFKYMELNLNPKLIDEPFYERLKFWNSLNIS